jgi:hypothetical protein
MMGTLNCIYETPCHWCSKWDKKCDCKIGTLSDGVDCNHKWEPTNSGGAYVDLNGVSKVYTNYRCKYCGKEERM